MRLPPIPPSLISRQALFRERSGFLSIAVNPVNEEQVILSRILILESRLCPEVSDHMLNEEVRPRGGIPANIDEEAPESAAARRLIPTSHKGYAPRSGRLFAQGPGWQVDRPQRSFHEPSRRACRR